MIYGKILMKKSSVSLRRYVKLIFVKDNAVWHFFYLSGYDLLLNAFKFKGWLTYSLFLIVLFILKGYEHFILQRFWLPEINILCLYRLWGNVIIIKFIMICWKTTWPADIFIFYRQSYPLFLPRWWFFFFFWCCERYLPQNHPCNSDHYMLKSSCITCWFIVTVFCFIWFGFCFKL